MEVKVMCDSQYNPQSMAVSIERMLKSYGLASDQDANQIRHDPIGFLDRALTFYEKLSTENPEDSAKFWDKYGGLDRNSLDEFGEEFAEALFQDLKALFE
ncbi:MAG: hypothetical protein QM689_04295 [Oscillospiraceae bacterium]